MPWLVKWPFLLSLFFLMIIVIYLSLIFLYVAIWYCNIYRCNMGAVMQDTASAWLYITCLHMYIYVLMDWKPACNITSAKTVTLSSTGHSNHGIPVLDEWQRLIISCWMQQIFPLWNNSSFHLARVNANYNKKTTDY